MSQQHERTVGADSDHHMVTGKTRCSKPSASPLSQHVGDEDELRPAGLMVGLAIVDEPDIRAGTPTGIGGSSFKHERDEALLAEAPRLAPHREPIRRRIVRLGHIAQAALGTKISRRMLASGEITPQQ
jgi:hypothetical protein